MALLSPLLSHPPLKFILVEVRFLNLGEDTDIKDKTKKWDQMLEQLGVEVEFLEKDELVGPARSNNESLWAAHIVDIVCPFSA